MVWLKYLELFPIGLSLFLVEGVEKYYWQLFSAKQSPTSYLTLGKAVATAGEQRLSDPLSSMPRPHGITPSSHNPYYS